MSEVDISKLSSEFESVTVGHQVMIAGDLVFFDDMTTEALTDEFHKVREGSMVKLKDHEEATFVPNGGLTLLSGGAIVDGGHGYMSYVTSQEMNAAVSPGFGAPAENPHASVAAKRAGNARNLKIFMKLQGRPRRRAPTF